MEVQQHIPTLALDGMKGQLHELASLPLGKETPLSNG